VFLLDTSTYLCRSRRSGRTAGLEQRIRKICQTRDQRPANRADETWAMDFVHDQLATDHKVRVLTIVDTFSRFSLALEPRFTFRGTEVAEILGRP
jgi:hypothetical protein